MMDWPNYHNGWGYTLMTIVMVLLLALLVGGVLLAGRRRGDAAISGEPARKRATAEEILAERYARGEIDESDYNRRLTTLHQGNST